MVTQGGAYLGNLTSYAGNPYTYGDSSHKHAVTSAYGNSYGYDGNGNQTSRTIGGVAYTFVFDYENRLTEVKQGTTTLATFLYDADGNRVKGTVSGVTTVYVAGIYEYQGGATTKYYEGGGLRRAGYTSNNGVFYMLSDHLKSTSALVARNGVLNVKYFYYPYGARRGVPFNTITAKHFTGQYHETALPGGEGLSFYNARWYDPRLGRFLSADTIVPNPSNPQDLNRLAYVRNNPLRYVDPSGHILCDGATSCAQGGSAQPGSGAAKKPTSPPRPRPAPNPDKYGNNVKLPASTGATSVTPWWQGIKPPPIRTIQPGGRYGHGEIQYGDRIVSLYLPPRVRVVSTVSQYHPLYVSFSEPAMLARSYVIDDWYGEPCSSGFCTIPGQWRVAAIHRNADWPNAIEALAGLGKGLGDSPESLPPGPDTTRMENVLDLRSTFFYGIHGALEQGRENLFILQQNASGDFRMIVITRQFADLKEYYVSADRLVPVVSPPLCVKGW